MAKIVFVVENPLSATDLISEQVSAIINTLALFPHEIKVITNSNPDFELKLHGPKIEVLRPFTKWKLWEAPKLMGLLLHFRPNILHFIQPFRVRPHSINHAIWTLPAMMSWPTPPMVVTSFFDLEMYRHHARTLKGVLNQSNIVTVINDKQRKEVLEHFTSGNNQSVEILPLNPPQQDPAFSSHWPPAAFEGFVYFLGPIGPKDEWKYILNIIEKLSKIRPRLGWIFTASFDQLSSFDQKLFLNQIQCKGLMERVIFLSQDSTALKIDLINKCQWVHFGNFAPGDFEFSYYLQLCTQLNVPVAMTQTQAAAESKLQQENDHCIFMDQTSIKNTDALLNFCRSIPLKQNESLSNNWSCHKEFNDSLGNRINRMYSLASRH